MRFLRAAFCDLAMFGLGFALAVGEAADKGGGFRDDAGQVQGLVKVAAVDGGLGHEAVRVQGLVEVAAVDGSLGHKVGHM